VPLGQPSTLCWPPLRAWMRRVSCLVRVLSSFFTLSQRLAPHEAWRRWGIFGIRVQFNWILR
jgi:hypothetical protein